MSTRSQIGRLDEDGTVTHVYCHFDGDVAGVGATLAQHYTDPAKVDQLLALGALSYLGPEIGEAHSYYVRDVPEWDLWCLAYGRDRGDKGTAAGVDHNVAQYWRRDLGEYLYLFADGAWQVRLPQARAWQDPPPPRPLADALAELEVADGPAR